MISSAVAIGMVSGFSTSSPSAQDEKQLAYVASQIGVSSTPSPVSAILDKSTGRVVAVLVVGQEGTKYAAVVDPSRPSRMILEAEKGGNSYGKRAGGVYVLDTRYEKVDLANRRQIESIFRIAGWEASLMQR
jgi:hypothetical protein